METAVAADVEESEVPEGATTWRRSSPHVKKALKFMERHDGCTAEALVAWDFDHGRHLFNWNDAAAADQWRLHSARVFINTFRQLANGLRMRAFVNVPAGEETGLEERRYVGISTISNTPKLRAWLMKNLTGRVASLTAELRMYSLRKSERRVLILEFVKGLGLEGDEAEDAE